MPDILINNLPNIVFGVLAVTSLIFYLLEHRSNQELTKRISDAGFKDVEEKSFNILQKAFNKAKSLVTQTQVDALTSASKNQAALRKFETEYEKRLDQQLNQALAIFNKYLEQLRDQSQKANLLNEAGIKTRSDETFARFEKNLTEFLSTMEQKSTQALDNELKVVRVLIEDYKKEQLSLIEENIIAMLEKTLSLVLVKKITLKDQVDMVYEALDKAKAEKFIV